jgi:transposase
LLLVCELGDISRFRTAKQVPAYFGLVPSVHASAQHCSYGPITKQGSKMVRWMLIQCAWTAVQTSMTFRIHFNSVSKRCGRNSAIISVARKLTRIAYRVLRDRTPFKDELVGQQAVPTKEPLATSMS